MDVKQQSSVNIPLGLIEAIRALPAERELEHCGATFVASPLDIYAQCPRCGARIKLRSFSGVEEIEDVFDAVLEWMSDPRAQQAAARRQREIEADKDE